MSRDAFGIRDGFATVWTWIVLVTTLLVFFPFILLWAIVGWPFDRANYLGGRLFRITGVVVVKLTPRWQFEVRGMLPNDPRRPYVVVANHESFADIIILCLLPWEMKWLSKRELMWIPLLGWLMWLSHDVPVRRGRTSSAKAALAACRRRLAQRVSVLIFPEGTRSSGSDLLPFKDGAFKLAAAAGVPILPIAIYGTRNAIARRDWRIRPAKAVVEVLSAEPTDGVEPGEVKRQVQQRIATARDKLRQEIDLAGG